MTKTTRFGILIYIYERISKTGFRCPSLFRMGCLFPLRAAGDSFNSNQTKFMDDCWDAYWVGDSGLSQNTVTNFFKNVDSFSSLSTSLMRMAGR